MVGLVSERNQYTQRPAAVIAMDGKESPYMTVNLSAHRMRYPTVDVQDKTFNAHTFITPVNGAVT